MNDLWSYSIESNEWTWISGSKYIDTYGNYGEIGESSNLTFPGSRYLSTSWFDSSNKKLWLFGGEGFNNETTKPEQDMLNDIWFFEIESKQWTWISGTWEYNFDSNYGDKEEAFSDFYPSARGGSVSWFDEENKIAWLFGGYRSSIGFLNDLWSFNLNTNEWAWVSGNVSTNE